LVQTYTTAVKGKEQFNNPWASRKCEWWHKKNEGDSSVNQSILIVKSLLTERSGVTDKHWKKTTLKKRHEHWKRECVKLWELWESRYWSQCW